MAIKNIVILKPNKSLNFSESINAGIRNSSNDKVFIANDDIIISKETIERLAKHCDENTITGPDSNCNVGWVTSKHYTVKGIPLVPAMLPKQIVGAVEDIYNIVPSSDNVPKEVDWLAFFATMVHRKTINEVGLLDENFVYDKEDLDYCVRAKKLGKKFLYCFDSYCFHFGGVSRKVKHAELGMKHLEDNEKNENYFKDKYKEGKKVIGFYCFNAWEYWDENSINGSVQDGKPKGIGGSETQAILVCRELSKLGYRVKIFNKCQEQHYDREGFDVEYIPWQHFGEFSKKIHYNYFVASRYLDCFDIPFSSGRNYAMIHDVFLIMNNRDKLDVKKERIHKYFCLSHEHKNFVSQYHDIPLDQIVVTSNGLDFTRFNNDVVKDPYKMIYSSSPDRGLDVLLDLFPRVKKEVPEVTLDIYYGFENFRDQEYVKKMMEKINSLDGVHYHGRVGQDELARHMQESSIWSYSSGFSETFCCHPETFVKTNFGWKKIVDIKEGDIVLTHKNNHSPVAKCLTREVSEDILKVKVKYLADRLRITKEHPVLILTKDKGRCKRRHNGAICTKNSKRCESGFCYLTKKDKKYFSKNDCAHLEKPFVLEWIPSEKLKKGDFIAYPINTKHEEPSNLSSYFEVDMKDDQMYHKKTRSNKITDFVIDEDFLMFCGWYVSEGSFDGKTTVTFSLNTNEEEERNFIKNIFIKLGLEPWVCTVDNSTTVNACSVVLASFLSKSFGKGSKNKKIAQWVKDLGTHYLKYFLKGVFKGDGCKTKNTMKYECSSKELTLDIFECLLKFKCISSLGNSIKKKPIRLKSGKIVRHETEKLPAYSLVCTLSQNKDLFEFIGYDVNTYAEYHVQQCIFDSNLVYLPINRIDKENYCGMVYNLEVEEDNTYIANGVIVHNCITALEAMAGGAVVLSSSFWGLIDTVKGGGILLPMPQGYQTVYTKEYQDKWVEECVKLLKDKDYQSMWREKGYERVKRFTWGAVASQWSEFFKSGNWVEIQ